MPAGAGVAVGVGTDVGADVGVDAGADAVTVVPLVAESDPPQPAARTAISTVPAAAAARVVDICPSPQSPAVRHGYFGQMRLLAEKLCG
jgi:thiazole synthase ThiGH ThiG subunit